MQNILPDSPNVSHSSDPGEALRKLFSKWSQEHPDVDIQQLKLGYIESGCTQSVRGESWYVAQYAVAPALLVDAEEKNIRYCILDMHTYDDPKDFLEQNAFHIEMGEGAYAIAKRITS